ncbi:MAG: Y4yA family PLP-dependent enzyme [Propionibacteriaceae bacterium]|nr:Y4yA family PLP-dependent enzyme [Propionibacteriaceae bacterium]
MTNAPHADLRAGVHGRPPLPARLDGWMVDLLADPDACATLLEQHGSPVNVIDPGPLARNAAELVDAGARHGVEVGIYFARKANKALALVRAAHAAGHGVDVASERELRQVLDAGVPGERIILSAAIKPDALLELAVRSGTTISVDGPAELDRITTVASTLGQDAHVAPRVAPSPATGLPPTRFGVTASAWAAVDWAGVQHVRALGVHAHLHGYAAAHRVAVLGECLPLTDALRAAGHPVAFVDLGGGVPMSYLDDRADWDAFWAAHASGNADEALTWKDHPLGTVYPYWQEPVRGGWLDGLLALRLADGSGTAASGLAERGLRLHLEPGRSLLDGCGLTLARVAFTKARSDGLGLVGLEMNRTQCRSTSDDFLVDPILVRREPTGEAVDGFLVGAYCIEDELILRRRMWFPGGVTAGDILALPNTGGYQMHILESASHQIPLARNVVPGPEGWELDAIDHGR